MVYVYTVQCIHRKADVCILSSDTLSIKNLNKFSNNFV